jgi:integrase
VFTATKKEKYFMFFVLCASAGLRFGEALGIDIKNISPNCSTVAIRQKAWRSQIHNFLKTKNGKTRN